MTAIYNVYCDESGHLEHDQIPVMVLGAVWCPLDKTVEIAARLREIKARHGLSPAFEVKWTKLSPAKQAFYLDLLDYFFDDDDLHFRALIVPDKSALHHENFRQSHDEWYYKMYFNMLKALFSPDAEYRTYLDIKDTRSAARINKLHDVLCNNMYDFDISIRESSRACRRCVRMRSSNCSWRTYSLERLSMLIAACTVIQPRSRWLIACASGRVTR